MTAAGRPSVGPPPFDRIEAGAEVETSVDLRSGDPGSRPDRVEVVYSVHPPETGEETFDDIGRFTNASGQSFDSGIPGVQDTSSPAMKMPRSPAAKSRCTKWVNMRRL